MKDHWTHYLPEGKRIFRDEVEKILSLEEHIKKVKAELSLLEKEHSIQEYELGQLAIEKGYSGIEIDIALEEFRQNNKH